MTIPEYAEVPAGNGDSEQQQIASAPQFDSIETRLGLIESYIELGWALFPVHAWEAAEEACSCHNPACSAPGKHPISSAVPHGVHDATNDYDQVMRWFRDEYPWANIGLATGARSGVDVIDIDSHNGVEGNIAWMRFWSEQGLPYPKTLEAATGGGGRHLFFRHVGGLGNRNGWLRGLDFKTDGGYVILPPSEHASGRPYLWPPVAAPRPQPLEMPEALIETLRKSHQRGPNGERLPDARSMLAGIAEGQRDATLFRWACQLRRLLDDDRDLITTLVLQAAANCEPPFPESDALAKVEQAFRQDHEDGERIGPDGFRLTPNGNGLRFAKKFGSEVLYLNGLGWHQWDGTVWVPRSDADMEALGKAVTNDLFDLLRYPDVTRQDQTMILRHATASDSPDGTAKLLRSARSDPGLLRSASEMNMDPFMLAVRNGVIDLRTGELIDISRHDFITHRSRYEYQPGADAPTWRAFVQWAMRGDQEMISFLQRLAGYTITGQFAEHVFPVMVGPGRNGKNVFFEVLEGVLGDLATKLPTDALTGRDENLQRTATLYGKRFAWMSETNRKVPINAAVMKSYTGDETLVGKLLYKDTFGFASSHTLWFASNHRPVITDNSEGTWKRVLLLPWEATLQPGQEIKNYSKVMLGREAPGIIAWLVEGALAWQRDGLQVPAVVRARTTTYRDDEDVLGNFIRDKLKAGPNEFCTRQQLKLAYDMWCTDEGIPDREREKPRQLVAMLTERLGANPNYSDGTRRGIKGFSVDGVFGL